MGRNFQDWAEWKSVLPAKHLISAMAALPKYTKDLQLTDSCSCHMQSDDAGCAVTYSSDRDLLALGVHPMRKARETTLMHLSLGW